MGVEKIARLKELDYERAQLVLRLDSLDKEMSDIIGEGFDIPGGRVVPTKRKQQRKGSPSAPANGSSPPPSRVTGDTKETSMRALAFVEAKGGAAVTPELAAAELGIDLTAARNALYWLYNSGKITRAERDGAPVRGQYVALSKKS